MTGIGRLPGMTGSHETWLDRQIRQAQERGEFDNLPGAGKPLPDHGELYDENWWLKQWVRRENLTGIAPTSLRIRKEADELMDRLAKETSEHSVRRIIADLNERIAQAQRGLVDGPPVVVKPVDVEATVEAWKRMRST